MGSASTSTRPSASASETEPHRGATPARPVGTPQQLRWLRGVVQAVLVLNLLDALFTIAWVSLDVAREANPFLHDLVSAHPVLFIAVKTTLVGLASALLWRLRERPLAVVGIFGAFLVYYALLVYHLAYLSWVIGPLVASSANLAGAQPSLASGSLRAGHPARLRTASTLESVRVMIGARRTRFAASQKREIFA